MALREIRKFPDPVLKKRTEPVKGVDDALQKLIDDMVETMYAAPGVGLAANQVGVAQRLAVIDTTVGKKPGQLHVLINTEIVTRPERVRVRYLDRNGDHRDMWGDGLMARALCHETDHLLGTLFVDH